MSALSIAQVLEKAADLRAGQKNACPVCGKWVMYQSYQSLFGSGLGQHIRASHPELEPEIKRASKLREQAEKKAAVEAAREAAQRPLREYVVTGAFLNEIAGEVGSLIDMMEPYYSQGNAADSAHKLLERIEAMQTEAAALARREGR